MIFPFGTLRPLSYDLIVADPPWDFENYSDKGTRKGADPHYRVMSLDAIRALPVSQLARGDCLLLLWATGAMLPKCIGTAEAWGFTYKTELVWRKTWPSGKPRMGTGYRARSFHEPIVLATIGAPKHKPFRSLFEGVSREHSRKPDAFFAMIEQCCAGLVNRAELFSREKRLGWECWGDQVGVFNQNVNLPNRRKSGNGMDHAGLLAHPPEPAVAGSATGPAPRRQARRARRQVRNGTGELFGEAAP